MKKTCTLILILAFCITCLFGCGVKFAEKTAKYEINATVDCTRATITGTEKVTYYHKLDEPTDSIWFNLYANAYAENTKYPAVNQSDEKVAYYDGVSYGNIDISSVYANGEALPFSIDETLLEVKLNDEIFLSESVILELSFFVALPYANTRLGVTPNCINVSGWYPVLCAVVGGEIRKDYCSSIGDTYLTETASYDVTLTYNSDFTLACTNGYTEMTKNADKITVCSKSDKVRDFAFVLSNKFSVKTKNVNGIDVSYYYINDSEPSKVVDYACNALVCFDTLFGAYPYGTYCLVQTDFVAGGMEFPQLVFIANSLKAEDIETVVVHETAHQWWYSVVGSDNINEAWQDEGLAEFSTLLYLAKTYGTDSYDKAIRLSYTEYSMFADIVASVCGSVSSVMSKNLNEFMSNYEYAHISYTKGLLLFDTLYKLSSSKTIKALKHYYANYAHDLAEYNDLIVSFKRVGYNAGGIIDCWTSGRVVMLTI